MPRPIWPCWECPVCGWIVSEIEYGQIVFDPDCQGCGAKKWSEFRYVEPDLDTREDA